MEFDSIKVRDQLGRPENKGIFVKRKEETVLIEEGPTVVTQPDVSALTIWGRDEWSSDSSYEWEGDSKPAGTVVCIVNPNNIFREYFGTNYFEDNTTTQIIDDCEAITDWTGVVFTFSLNSTTYFEGSNSINLIKSDTSSESCLAYKIIASPLDADIYGIVVLVYAKDSTTLNKINQTRVFAGNNSSNYLYTEPTLSTGWNAICINSGYSTEVGTVDKSQIDYIGIALITNNASDTFAAGDLMMDYWHIPVTTADWADTELELDMTNGEVAQSNEIAYATGTLTSAKITATVSAGDVSDLAFQLTADGGSHWENVTHSTTHTFTNTGTDLRFIITASGNVTVTQVQVEYTTT